MYNDDCTVFFCLKNHKDYQFGEVTEKDVKEYIRRFANTTITDFVLNINFQLSAVPSKVLETFEDKYQTTVENGHEVDYEYTCYKVWHDLYVLQNVDVYKIWIEELRKANINPWLSFRLNDTHDNFVRYGGPRRSAYCDMARENGLVRTKHREKTDYFDDCLDYGLEEVRLRMLNYIEEQMNAYDVNGIEIDYMREPYICSPGKEDECRRIMNEFFDEIRKILDKSECKYGHKIKLSVRCFRDPAATYDSGLDIFSLIRNKIIDVVIPTPRWQTCDSDMPIYLWKKIFENDCVEIAAGTDMLYQSNRNIEKYICNETITALAMQYLTSGADYIYMFNYSYLFRSNPELVDSAVYKYIGNINLMEDKVRRHIMSFQDVGYLYSTLYKPLPREISQNYSFFRVQTGKISDNSKVILRLGCDSKKMTVYVNSQKCEFLGECEIEKEYHDGIIQEFQITGYNQLEQIIEIKCQEKSMLNYIEIMVVPLGKHN